MIKKVFIRVDGNENIATGHIVRCLAIAKALLHEGLMVSFLVSDEDSVENLTRLSGGQWKTDEIINLGSNYERLEEELPLLKSLLVKDGYVSKNEALFFLDSYFVTPDYLKEIRMVLPVAYLDDLYSFDYEVDCIINYDFEADKDFYSNARKVYAGPEYTPLRDGFTKEVVSSLEKVKNNAVNDTVSGNIECEGIKSLKRILITSGGTNPGMVSEKIGRVLADNCDASITILVRDADAPGEELSKLVSSKKNIKLHSYVSDMPTFLPTFDLVISAGGTTMYELCALGIPALSYSIADNQLKCVTDLDKMEIVSYLGNPITDFDNFSNRLIPEIKKLQETPQLLEKQSIKMKNLVDGKGAARIARALRLL